MKLNLKQIFVCTSCGSVHPKWMGRCTDCQSWNTVIEEVISKSSQNYSVSQIISTPINKIEYLQEQRTLTGVSEFDRVLGGGFVSGSLLLISGDPGIGKSTLLLQTLFGIASQGKKVIYASGEESPQQIKMRAERLETLHENILVTNETDIHAIIDEARKIKPHVLVIDSIQTVFNPNIGSTAGTVSQIRECANLFMQFAKKDKVTIFIIGHVTKDGMIAGPKILEHLVDCALHLEGDLSSGYRILRSHKNRFGSTGEIGVFAMHGHGLIEVANPSSLFITDSNVTLEGSAIAVSMEGSRPILLEVQVLVGKTSFSTPRRLSTGIDSNRFTILLAVLEKRSGLCLSQLDIYANITGGFKVQEPAIDLATAAAVASSLFSKPLPRRSAFVGEVGLSGEVRRTNHIAARLQECVKLGFDKIFLPAQSFQIEKENISKILDKAENEIMIIPVETVNEVVRFDF